MMMLSVACPSALAEVKVQLLGQGHCVSASVALEDLLMHTHSPWRVTAKRRQGSGP